MALSGDTAAGRLAIIAGGGLLPSYVAEAARAAGENPVIVALKDESDRRWDGYDHAVIAIGDFAALEGLLNRYGIGRVVMSGSVRRRPEWREVRPTLRTLMKMPAAIRTLLSGGDDTVLQMVIRLIEGNGRRVVGAHEIAPDLLAAVGPLGTAIPGEEDRRDINRAAEAAEMLGRLDVGQAPWPSAGASSRWRGRKARTRCWSVSPVSEPPDASLHAVAARSSSSASLSRIFAQTCRRSAFPRS